ncbi:MarR family transcriptional regulator [Roseomonas sp. GC11]|uniref:MarR family winged helix-turn-helix transcriptional regulator n=1 Tax=Roseomonas sp. GC11 TaxID=2950546 RepID=UPI002108CA4C|nr:MarR family transcriptional regulator [Roseomonas sp. GC11]MCQ4159897.1 MarR family transcriptional regulator [Roseomonas sp. GC11]
MPPKKPRLPRQEANPASPFYRIEKSPLYHAARLVGAYHRRMNAVLKPIGMDVPQWRVLGLLDARGPSTVSRIADEAVAQLSTMAKIIQRMALQGLVTTEVSSEDARSVIVSITGQGREALEQVREKAGLIFEEAFRGVADEEMLEFARLAEKIYGNLSL